MIDVTRFGTRDWPLRPSKLPDLIKCPMNVLLTTFGGDDDGNQGAQTGSVVHRAVETFHNPAGGRVAALTAMESAFADFPEADRDKARRWVAAYLADPTNKAADVIACEAPVELDYKGVYIKGTLDQIRRNRDDGLLLVWDLKTGSYLQPEDAVAEYQFQQAAYVLGARQTLALDVHPGGIIYAAGYDKARGRRFLPMGVTVKQCELLMDEVVETVQRVRAGGRPFRPTSGACKWCPLKPFPNCEDTCNRILGEAK